MIDTKFKLKGEYLAEDIVELPMEKVIEVFEDECIPLGYVFGKRVFADDDKFIYQHIAYEAIEIWEEYPNRVRIRPIPHDEIVTHHQYMRPLEIQEQ